MMVKARPSIVALGAIAVLATVPAMRAEEITSSDTIPKVPLTDGVAVCADDGIDAIAASEIEWWLHSNPKAGFDKRITAALRISIHGAGLTFHAGTTTTCDSRGVSIAFVLPDGSISESTISAARFMVTGSEHGSPRVAVDRASLREAARKLATLQEAELAREKMYAPQAR